MLLYYTKTLVKKNTTNNRNGCLLEDNMASDIVNSNIITISHSEQLFMSYMSDKIHITQPLNVFLGHR